MCVKEFIAEREDRLKQMIDIFTIIYIVSIYIFAIAFDHWVQSYSNLIALVYLFFLACYAFCHHDKIISDFSKLYLPFLFLCALSFFWTLDKSYCFKLTVELSAMYVLVILMYNYLSQEHKTTYILNGLYIGGVCLMCGTVLYYGVAEYFRGFMEGERMGHILGNVNEVGVRTSYSALIALYYCLYRKKWINIIPTVMLMIFASGTGSRKVVVFLIAGIFFLIFCMNGWKAKLYAFVVVFGIVLIYLYVPLFDGIMKRFFDMVGVVNGETDGSTAVRIEMVKYALIQIKETPLFGIGLGSSHILISQTCNLDTYTHNNYIELLLILGVFGFGFWYFHYLFPVKTIIKAVFKHNNIAILTFSFVLLGLMVHLGTVDYQKRFQIILVLYFYLVKHDLNSTDL